MRDFVRRNGRAGGATATAYRAALSAASRRGACDRHDAKGAERVTRSESFRRHASLNELLIAPTHLLLFCYTQLRHAMTLAILQFCCTEPLRRRRATVCRQRSVIWVSHGDRVRLPRRVNPRIEMDCGAFRRMPVFSGASYCPALPREHEWFCRRLQGRGGRRRALTEPDPTVRSGQRRQAGISRSAAAPPACDSHRTPAI